ncbi:hypothetical protein [Nocardioides donggukensis]|uniref:Uncharacterized protein n=1 Tax=Nocardioides donggukensis TaxID=2774019 RepID=A0A927Q0Z8_9ACTN|nr:hypothetical protein [Nocardioides donggukensis]MBD8869507.1 hypothetical protein [Nocardioides donggukensis]
MRDDEIACATLLDWLEGRLPDDASAAVAERVRNGGPDLRETVGWLREFLEFTRTHWLHDVPPIVGQSLREAFDQHRRGGEAPAPRRIRPTLLFDSRSERELVGVRGGPMHRAGDVIHLAYTCPDADLLLDVTVRPTGDLDLAGQVFGRGGPGPPVFEATVHAGGRTSRSVDGDDLGRFRFTHQPVPLERLTATNGDIVLDVALDVGRP